ncbi:MAG: hypothetical protein Q9171_001679 [Xanthocarpia ochracea]
MAGSKVRIDKRAYLVSTAVLLGICIISVFLRFYIRIKVQKAFSVDDAILMGAFCCLLCSLVIMYSTVLDKLYLIMVLSASLPDALSIGFPIEDLPMDSTFLRPVYEYLKWITINQALGWCSIIAVKFSFLFLFKKMLDRIPPMITYWWFVVAFNTIAWGYGFSTYFLNCPYYNNPKIFECSSPSGVSRLLRHGIALTAVDVVGDLLILFIPIKLIWKVQIKWTQKVPLALSLCLTGIMILVTITRIAGIKFHGQNDIVWESYFLIVAAEVGVILASISTYRALFVAHRKATIKKAKYGGPGSSPNRQILRRLLDSSPWRSRAGGQSIPGNSTASHFDKGALPSIPRAHMTGVRTFINGQGQRMDASNIMESQMIQDEDEDGDGALSRVYHDHKVMRDEESSCGSY